MTSDVPTEPPAGEGALRPPTEAELLLALSRWLVGRPLPRALRRLLAAAILEPGEEGRARRLETPRERLPEWERCFARWALTTLESAVAQVWTLALGAEALGAESADEEE